MESQQTSTSKDSTSLNDAFKKFGNKSSGKSYSKSYSSGGYRQRSNLNETMELDKGVIGLVIGKAGANIRELQEKTGTRMKIDRDTSQLVISSNNLDKIKAAKEVVTKFISDNNNNRQNFRGRGNYSSNSVKKKYVPQIFNIEDELSKGGFPSFQEAYPAM